jgi:hypothetical protein
MAIASMTAANASRNHDAPAGPNVAMAGADSAAPNWIDDIDIRHIRAPAAMPDEEAD